MTKPFQLYGQALRRLANQLLPTRGVYTEFHPTGGHRSLFVRHFDGGSSGDVELEIANLFGPVYDAERLGLRLVASPRHADVLLITGPITRQLRPVLQLTIEALPRPYRLALIGDDALGLGFFRDSPEVVGLPVDLEPYVAARVPGDPPTPQAIIEALLQISLTHLKE